MPGAITIVVQTKSHFDVKHTFRVLHIKDAVVHEWDATSVEGVFCVRGERVRGPKKCRLSALTIVRAYRPIRELL